MEVEMVDNNEEKLDNKDNETYYGFNYGFFSTWHFI